MQITLEIENTTKALYGLPKFKVTAKACESECIATSYQLIRAINDSVEKLLRERGYIDQPDTVWQTSLSHNGQAFLRLYATCPDKPLYELCPC